MRNGSMRAIVQHPGQEHLGRLRGDPGTGERTYNGAMMCHPEPVAVIVVAARHRGREPAWLRPEAVPEALAVWVLVRWR